MRSDVALIREILRASTVSDVHRALAFDALERLEKDATKAELWDVTRRRLLEEAAALGRCLDATV